MTRKRRDVVFMDNGVKLDGATYTLEGVPAPTVWRLAAEGLVARLKRAADASKAYQDILAFGVTPQPKKDRWVEAWAEASGATYETLFALWENMTKEQRTQIRTHPEVYAAYHKEAAPLESLVKQ